jgi:alkanesulfonate monooxygenase SsuD/methylene tetrahydromethanopterin reductase-like flavin-dependent oxidoreductase (luciferase family)
MKFHIILEANSSHLEIARLAQLAEGYGMAGIWTSNMHDSRDPFINFTEAARVTRSIRLGPVASGKPVTYKGGMYQVLYYHSSWVTQPPPDVFVCAGGPQMIAASARYAQGIFVGHHLPHHVERIDKVVQAGRAGAGRKDDDFRLLNFWAWHVKENQDEARAEARV